MYVAWRQIDWETFTLWLQDLKKKNLIWQRSYHNYHKVDISIKKRTKLKNDAHYEGVIMKLIEKGAKKNGKKYVMQIQKEAKRQSNKT